MSTDRVTQLIQAPEPGAAQSQAPMLQVPQLVKRRAALESLREVMRDRVHYMKIPGTGPNTLPSLLKPGAELVAAMFRISCTPQVEYDNRDGEIVYTVTHLAVHSPTGLVLGSGVGVCSSDEEKYAWRRPECQDEFDSTAEDMRRIKWNGQARENQVRRHPASMRQTILAMADKRAFVSVIRRVTAASDLFTEGLEDLPDDQVDRIRERDHQEPARDAERGARPAERKPSKEEISGHAQLAHERIQSARTLDELAEAQDLVRDVPDAKTRARLNQSAMARHEELSA